VTLRAFLGREPGFVVAAMLSVLLPCRAAAQVVPGEGAAIGMPSADRARVMEITGHAPDSVMAHVVGRVVPIRPTARLTWNSALPASGNDGTLWAGRGANASISGGAAYRRAIGTLQLEVRAEPELSYSQNRPFQFTRGREPGRSAFSSPWHLGSASADLPLRFGDLPLTAANPGQSAVTLSTRRVAFGVTSAHEWWGPAQRNTLVLSNNAPGVPRLFVRTTQRLQTRFGAFAGRTMIGALTESRFFDTADSNDLRAVNGVLVTFRPAIDTGLTLGLSRVVIAPTSSGAGALSHLVDVLFRWDASAPESGSGGRGSDQILSLFARWVFPASGFEMYTEWARTDLPRSLREYLAAPQHSLGYTAGLQWVSTPTGARHLRLRGEVTYLEQTAVLDRAPQDFYTGRAAVQGFTQRGQLLGAAIGPGSSSQFIGADWLTARWDAGVFVARTRTENDALYRQFRPRLTQHDVTLQAGARGVVRLRDADLAAEVAAGPRYNYLFESDYYLGSPLNAMDIRNVTLSFSLSPH
jgi:hypothetical protein